MFWHVMLNVEYIQFFSKDGNKLSIKVKLTPEIKKIVEIRRSQFKYALRTVKNNENVLRKESLANKLSCSNPNKFWQEIRTMTSKSTSLPSSIEGVSGKHAVSELWKSHFGRLLNVIQDDGLCDISCDTTYSDDIHVSTNEVVLAVHALCANKASGLDDIVAEHLLYSSERWCTMLAMCLSGLFVHVFFT